MLAVSARPPSNPGFVYGTNSSVTSPVTQYPIGPNDSPVVDHTQSPHHFGAGPGYHQPTTAFYGTQRASPAFGFADQHPGTAFLVSSSNQSEESCPAPIPLPSEVARGQSLTISGFESQELATAALVSNTAVKCSTAGSHSTVKQVFHNNCDGNMQCIIINVYYLSAVQSKNFESS